MEYNCVATGADPGFDQGGGPQIVTGLKLPFWGLSFVEFWCWGLIFGGQGGGPGPPGPPPGSAPGQSTRKMRKTNFVYRISVQMQMINYAYCCKE